MKYVIFGAGSGGQKIYDIIVRNNLFDIECFLDNKPKAEEINGVPIRKAGDYLKSKETADIVFIIASVYRDEIISQLLSVNVPINHIWGKANIFYILYTQKEWGPYGVKKIGVEKENLIFDCGSGYGLGGVESWTYLLARGLKDKKKIHLVAKDCPFTPPEDLAIFASTIPGITSFFDYMEESIDKLIKYLADRLPCVVISAHTDDFLMAAIILKKKFPKSVRIISVVHGGLPSIMADSALVEADVDKIFTVSPDARLYLIEKYGISPDKILFKETPTWMKYDNCRSYTLDTNKPLRIGYSARLEKTHKHSELLIPLIEILEERRVGYELFVAGTGALFEEIESFISNNHYENHVHLQGRIAYEKMEKFWTGCDIAINLSECEGCCVSMIESMAMGVVPIFTDVFSTKYFINDGENGFVVPYKDLNLMVQKIELLDKERNRLPIMGNAAKEFIIRNCSAEAYVEFWSKLITEQF